LSLVCFSEWALPTLTWKGFTEGKTAIASVLLGMQRCDRAFCARCDRSELALAQLVLGTDIPVLGICRGLEVLVVATGGSLVSHLPDEFGEAVVHRADQLPSVEHSVQITPESSQSNSWDNTDKGDVKASLIG